MTIEDVWSQFQARLTAFLAKQISNPADVDDIKQEVLLKIFHHLSDVRDVTKLKSWLFQLARNAVIDFYRKNAKQKKLTEQGAGEIEALWYQAQQPSLFDELGQCLLPFIQALESQDAQLLTAIDIDGISQKQYATQQNINYSTLKSRVKKARTQLLNLYQNCCELKLDQQGNLLAVGEPKSNCNC